MRPSFKIVDRRGGDLGPGEPPDCGEDHHTTTTPVRKDGDIINYDL
jgi:hypothetical protein